MFRMLVANKAFAGRVAAPANFDAMFQTENNVSVFEFSKAAWQDLAPGARFKVFQEAGKQLRLVEFTSDFVEEDWCERGHTGLVLSGELEVQFDNEILRYPEGAAILIKPGTEHRHKARSVTSVVKLFLVEDI